MNTVLFFQNLAVIATDLARLDILLPWPKAEWRLSNSIHVSREVSPRRWNEAHDAYYGYDRRSWYQRPLFEEGV